MRPSALIRSDTRRGKAGVERRAPGDQNIVEVASRMFAHNVTDGSLEPPLDAIPLHRNSDLLADGEAKSGSMAWRVFSLVNPPLGFQYERRRCETGPFADAQKLRTAL